MPYKQCVRMGCLASLGSNRNSATNLFSWEDFAVLFVVFTDADEVAALEFADSHTAETTTKLHKLELQLQLHKDP